MAQTNSFLLMRLVTSLPIIDEKTRCVRVWQHSIARVCHSICFAKNVNGGNGSILFQVGGGLLAFSCLLGPGNLVCANSITPPPPQKQNQGPSTNPN